MSIISPISLSNPEALLGKIQEFSPKNKLGALDAAGLDAAGFERALSASLGTGVKGTESMRGLEAPGAVSFTNMLETAVDGINSKMQASRQAQERLLTGESTNLHQTMIAMQESGVAFTLMVEVRNKLVESYQEMMRMQV